MDLKFANTTIDVTPEKEIPLSGFLHRVPNSKHLGIKSCELKIVWFSFSDSEQYIFFLADYLFFPNQLAQNISSFVLNQYKIPKGQLIFGGTHSHSGPALGFLPWEKEQPEYLNIIEKKLQVALRDLALKLDRGNMQQALVDVNNISINRRLPLRFWKWAFKKKALMFPNPSGPVNANMKVLQFVNTAGKKIWLISYASHPVFNRNLELSSDYPGLLAQSIKEKGWADEVLVFPGFGGDVRPNYQQKRRFKIILRTLSFGAEFAKYSTEHFADFNHKIMKALANINFSTPLKLQRPQLEQQAITLPSQSGQSEKILHLKKIVFSPAVVFVTANAEMFVQYELDLPDFVFTISCTDDCIGYVPTASEVALGGYEVEDAARNNGLDSPFSAEGLRTVTKKLKAFFQY